jgi:hypothetical protein
MDGPSNVTGHDDDGRLHDYAGRRSFMNTRTRRGVM